MSETREVALNEEGADFTLGASTMFNPADLIDALQDILKLSAPLREIEIVIVDQIPTQLIGDLRRIADDHRLTYTVHAPLLYADLAFQLEEVREIYKRRVRESISFAAEIDAKRITVHGGQISIKLPAIKPFNPFRVDRTKYISTCCEALRELTDYAKTLGLKTCIENTTRGIGKYPDEIKYLFRQVPDLGFTLDVGHANVTGNLEQYISLNPDHLHLHDNNGLEDSHLPLGCGMVNHDSI
ncbi:MAG: sugar phosphate isomerase/epimerase family protein, partial [Candidatus Acetothermia bacterium]